MMLAFTCSTTNFVQDLCCSTFDLREFQSAARGDVRFIMGLEAVQGGYPVPRPNLVGLTHHVSGEKLRGPRTNSSGAHKFIGRNEGGFNFIEQETFNTELI